MNKFLNEFEEIWIDEPELEIDLSKVKFGKSGPNFNVLDKVIVNNFYKNVNNKIGYIIDYFDYDNTYLIYFIEKFLKLEETPVRCKKYNIPNGYTLWILPKYLEKYNE